MKRPASASSAALLALSYLAFVSLGLPDAVLGVAWPSLRESFELPRSLLGLPLAFGAAAYFASGIMAGGLMRRLGIGRLLAASTGLAAAGVLGYSASPAFALVLLSATVVGLGSGAIDAALNTYAARGFSPKHLSWLHAAYAAGAMGGPAVMTALLGGGASWRVGYALIGAALAALALAFVAARQRWDAGPSASAVVVDAPGSVGPVALQGDSISGLSALRHPRVRLQVAVFFVYAGVELSAGQWAYTILTEGRGLGHSAAGMSVAAYWGGLLAGRLLLGLVVERIGQVRLLRLSTAGVVAFAALFAVPGWEWGAAALPLLSFSLASIYPGLMAETPRRVGESVAPHAVGFQVSAATLGVVALPNLAGLFAEWLGLEAIGAVILALSMLLLGLHEWLVRLSARPG